MLSNTGNFLLSLNIFLSALIMYYSYNNLKSSDKLIFKNVFNKVLFSKKNSFDTSSSKLQAFSPLSVLSRGYTVSTKDGELLDNTKLTEGDEILTRTERNLILS